MIDPRRKPSPVFFAMQHLRRFTTTKRFAVTARMKAAELYVRNTSLINIVVRSYTRIKLAIQKTKMNLYCLFIGEAVTRFAVRRHIKDPLYGSLDTLDTKVRARNNARVVTTFASLPRDLALD